jgi:hypothetical protein
MINVTCSSALVRPASVLTACRSARLIAADPEHAG